MDGESTSVAASASMIAYFARLQKEIDACYTLAESARKKGLDPELHIEIPQALDLAIRVERLVGPEGIAPTIREVTKDLENRELVSLEIARKIVGGETSYKITKVEEALDQAVRTGLAILTEGVLVAPIEGIADVKLGNNSDGTKYVDLYFSGPIRSAGGTGQAMSVLIADIVRRELGIDCYKPTDGEVERYKEEIPLYKRAQHLQYTPTSEEIDLVSRNCPICINGEGTEDVEVTGYRDLPRIETNRLRGGACLVIAEGLCLKAPKLMKHVKKLQIEGWDFLESFINKDDDDQNDEDAKDAIPTIEPATKYIKEIIAGRPVLSHPSRKGGFRLRYGRARTAGLASCAMSPATMYIADSFITIGTQMKTERPGKATIGTPCDRIEGPIVLLENEDLVQINTVEQLKTMTCDVKTIIDIGELLIPFGEFIENNSLLPESSYVTEWWIQDLQSKLNLLPSKQTPHEIQESDKKTKKILKKTFDEDIDLNTPTLQQALQLCTTYQIPLHPYYNLFWHDLSIQQLKNLSNYLLSNAKISSENQLFIAHDPEIKNILIELGCLHSHTETGMKVDLRYSNILLLGCGLEIKDSQIVETSRRALLQEKTEDSNIIQTVSGLSGITIKARAPFRIGARMGRPEKAAERKMKPPPHVLFPLGNYGTNQRLLKKACEYKSIDVEVGKRTCSSCGKTTYKVTCSCGGHTSPLEGRIETQEIKLKEELKAAQQNLLEQRLPQTIKGVIGTISKHKTPEPLEKGILRAKHGVYTFKDGTIRFDMTDAPLTHFRAREIGVSVKTLKELGYSHDYLGKPLATREQILELKVQDVIISRSCADYFTKTARYIDDLLKKYYKMEPYYHIRRPEDLIGHLTIGLAPHTSAGVLTRIIGFTTAKVCYGHPFFHANKRRNADGDEDGLMLLMDALLNFSLSYIPDKRGGKMDLPLVLTTRINPSEVDKEAHNVDTHARYPLKFYEATERHEHSKTLEDEMGLVASRIGTDDQYEHFAFTHDTTDINCGPVESIYKTLGSMMEKMEVQLSLAAKLRCVDEGDVAYKVIQKHFLPDIIGNLRSFSKQSVRCPRCNISYRRIPLKGVCTHCGGKLTLTVHEMSVKKYLEISKQLGEHYNLPKYARQRIELVECSINSLFENDKVKYPKITEFF